MGGDGLVNETPRRRLVGLEWSSEDMAKLYAAQFGDAPAAPPPDLPYGPIPRLVPEDRRGRAGPPAMPTARRCGA